MDRYTIHSGTYMRTYKYLHIMIMDRYIIHSGTCMWTFQTFFLVNGCQRTPKEDLIRLEIIQKVTDQSESLKSSSSQQRLSRYSRPGSSYVLSMSMDNDGMKEGMKETRKVSLNTSC